MFHIRWRDLTRAALAEYDDMIKTLPSDRADQPFSLSVLAWLMRCCLLVSNPYRAKSPFYYRAAGASASLA